MQLRNCPICGKIFVYNMKKMCPDCAKKDEDDFEKVRDYLYENPGATIEEVSEQTEVDTKKILEFLKEGRLMLKNENPNLLRCEICDCPILTGKYCEKCAKDMKKQLNNVRGDLSSRSKIGGQIHLSKYRREK